MDSIDITDSTFSLGISDLNQCIGGGINNDYTMYIYIGISILVIVIGIFIFNFYQNKKRNHSEYGEQDCAGGFCTINQSQNQSQNQNQYESQSQI